MAVKEEETGEGGGGVIHRSHVGRLLEEYVYKNWWVGLAAEGRMIVLCWGGALLHCCCDAAITHSSSVN